MRLGELWRGAGMRGSQFLMGLIEVVTLEQRCGVGKGLGSAGNLQRVSQHRGSKGGAGLACLRTRKEAGMAQAEGVGGMGEDKRS